MRTRLLAASVALVVLGVSLLVVREPQPLRRTALASDRIAATTTVAPTTSTMPTTTVPVTTTVVTAPPPTAAPPTVVRRIAAARPMPTQPVPIAQTAALRSDSPLVPGDAAMFRGLGAWIDVYDWSREYTGGKPVVGPNDVDRMADLGVQALYVQAAKQSSANDVVDADLLRPIIERAHARGMRVTAWYLPTLEDPARDLQRLLAIAGLQVDALGVDIEGRQVADVGERNRRLVDLSVALRQRLPGVPLAAIVMPAVVMEVINPNFWPGFPYRELAPAYDAWMPMDYWTNRTAASGYRDAYRYTAENIDRLRAQLGRPDVPVHAVGGIGDTCTPEDLDRFRLAASERHAIGGSIYDYRTTRDELWSHLQPFRS